jgi:hypothetical protein
VNERGEKKMAEGKDRYTVLMVEKVSPLSNLLGGARGNGVMLDNAMCIIDVHYATGAAV